MTEQPVGIHELIPSFSTWVLGRELKSSMLVENTAKQFHQPLLKNYILISVLLQI